MPHLYLLCAYAPSAYAPCAPNVRADEEDEDQAAERADTRQRDAAPAPALITLRLRFDLLGDRFMLAKEYLSLGQGYQEGDELDHAEFFVHKAAVLIEQLDNAPLDALARELSALRPRRSRQ